MPRSDWPYDDVERRGCSSIAAGRSVMRCGSTAGTSFGARPSVESPSMAPCLELHGTAAVHPGGVGEIRGTANICVATGIKGRRRLGPIMQRQACKPLCSPDLFGSIQQRDQAACWALHGRSSDELSAQSTHAGSISLPGFAPCDAAAVRQRYLGRHGRRDPIDPASSALRCARTSTWKLTPMKLDGPAVAQRCCLQLSSRIRLVNRVNRLFDFRDREVAPLDAFLVKLATCPRLSGRCLYEGASPCSST